MRITTQLATTWGDFLEQWDFAAAGQDLETLTSAISVARTNTRNRRKRNSTIVKDWLLDLRHEIDEGWTGHGQTNHLLKTIACHGVVIRVSNEVYDTPMSEAKKQKITLTKLCCQEINFLIANLYSAEINNSLKKTCTSQLITSSLENSTSVISSLDFEMSQLQELENRISNIERALVRLFGAIPNQINDLGISNELNIGSTKTPKTHEETAESKLYMLQRTKTLMKKIL